MSTSSRRSLAGIGNATRLIFVVLLVACGAGSTATAQFLPPGIVNAWADVDPFEDLYASHVIDENGVMHVVWASQNPYAAPGDSDPDIFYSRNEGGGWTFPTAVNTWAATDSDIDEAPRLALDPEGGLHCVWQSRNDSGGTGGDWDIYYRQFTTAAGWLSVESVNSDAATDNGSLWNDDIRPNVAVVGDGTAVVVWEIAEGADHPALRRRERSGSGWGPDEELMGYGVGPAATTTAADGRVVVAFQYLDPLSGNHSIVFSERGVGGLWSRSTIIANATADNRYPAVATYGSGEDFERHFVWASRLDEDGTGTDFDLRHLVMFANLGDLGPQVIGPAWLNSNADSDGSHDDERPSLCMEPGGALHVVWQSTVDLGTGTDLDVFHAFNATQGSGWSPVELLGLNAVFDDPGEHDTDPEIRCAANHVLSGMWSSMDDAGGTLGNDRDLFHALGLGRVYHRPEPVSAEAYRDSGDSSSIRVVESGGTAHYIWYSKSDTGGAGPSDFDIFHTTSTRGPHVLAELVNITGLGEDGIDGVPDLAIDRQGRLHAIWVGEHGTSDDLDKDIYYAWSDGSGWSFPELVNTNGASDDGDDNVPRIGVDAGGVVHAAWRGPANSLAYARRTNPGGWTAAETPAVPVELGLTLSLDLHVEPDGTVHLVWRSWADVGGSGTDGDIYWARRLGGTWAPAELVNDYGTSDSHSDGRPSLAVAPDGEIIVVWSSGYDPGGAGADSDILINRRDPAAGGPSGWGSSSLLVTHFTGDAGVDREPSVSATSAAIHVVWGSDDDFAGAGTDLDIFHVAIPRSSVLPADVGVGFVNAASGDSSDDFSPCLVVSPCGTVFFSWQTFDDLGGTISDYLNVVSSRLGDLDGIFCDSFEYGDTSEWSAERP